jgi:hypothetical protein
MSYADPSRSMVAPARIGPKSGEICTNLQLAAFRFEGLGAVPSQFVLGLVRLDA